MNTKEIAKFEAVNDVMLKDITGGSCNWKDAGAMTIGGVVGGVISAGPVGALGGAIGGYLGYSATCWW